MTQTAARGMERAEGPAAGSAAAVLEGFSSRRSIRRYTRQPLAERQIAAILHAMSWAPSAHNRQPFRIIRLDDEAWKARLAQAMGERLRADRLRDGDGAELVERDVRRSFERITGAPLVLVLCADMTPMDRYPDAGRQGAERLMAVQSVAVAAQNGLLAAHALGLGACWMCAPLFCADVVIGTLGVPADWQPQILLTIGHPANAGKPPSRHPVADIVWRPG